MVAFPMLAAACALAGVPAVADPVRRRFLAERERELGIRIPAAVAEWYAIDGAVEHLIQESCAIIVRLEQLGTASDGRDLAATCGVGLPGLLRLAGRPYLPGQLGGAAARADDAGRASGCRGQGADPAVWLSWPGEPAATWTLAAPRFSTYAYAEVWDIAFGALPHDACVDAVDGVPFGDSDLAVLRRELVAGPRSSGWAGHFGAPDLVVHRFERPGQRVRVAAHPEETEWWLAAESAESLQRLVALLSKADDALARKLRPAR
jgi:hypothetical protein